MEAGRATQQGTGSRRFRAAAIYTPGLEAVCRRELIDLGVKPKAAGPGTFEFEATARQVYAANMWLRTASRVLVRVATFRATDFAHLQAAAAEVDWSLWLADGVAPKFRVSANESKLYHTEAVAQRLHQVVGPPSGGEPEQLFVVRVDRNTVTISVDASGQALHHRPWRTELGEAPLRTTMAAALLLATGWDGSESLLDPFCGAGTIAIEAALLARKMPPGGLRPFAFQTWPSFEVGAWASVTGQVSARLKPAADITIHASDRDADMVRAAQANAGRAGVEADIGFEARVVSHLRSQPGPGLVATNPPFGKRLMDGRLDGLYRRFGAVVHQRLGGWALAMICADRELAAVTDARLSSLARFRHGGLPVELLYRGAPGPSASATSGPTPRRRSASEPEPPDRPEGSTG